MESGDLFGDDVDWWLVLGWKGRQLVDVCLTDPDYYVDVWTPMMSNRVEDSWIVIVGRDR